MRIAFLVDRFPTLSETFILQQIKGSIDRGHQVDIFSDRPGDTAKMHPEVEQYKLLERNYYLAPPRNPLLRVLQGLYLLAVNFFKAPQIFLKSFNFIKYRRNRYGEQAAFFKPLYAVIPWLDRPAYDIIHCHYGRNGLRAILLKDLGVITGKITVVFHGNDISRYLEIHGVDVYQYLFTQADLLQPISQHWQNRLIKLGCSQEKILVHHMGIDCDRFTVKPKPNQPGRIVRIVTIARLVEKKGLKYGIAAVAKLIKTYPNLEYQIVGDGVLRESLQQQIDSLNIARQVRLLGWKEQQEVTKIIAAADIFIAPSVTASSGDCEGIPVSLMEAMAMGLPVVSTYHSGIPELIEDGVSGYLVPEKDVDLLAAKLANLIAAPELRAKMGREGRNKIETEFNSDRLNDRLVEIYQQLVEQ